MLEVPRTRPRRPTIPQQTPAEGDAPAAANPTAEGDPTAETNTTVGDPTAEADPTTVDSQELVPADDRSRTRRVTTWVITALAALLVFAALVAPSEASHLTPGAFLRIPVEALLGLALVLVLPVKARRVVVVFAGAGLGLLTIVNLINIGFLSVLARPFDPLSDWTLAGTAMDLLTESIGRVGAIAAVIAVAILAVVLLVLMPLSVLRVYRLVVGHRVPAIRTGAVLGVVWVICAALGAQIVPDVPVASKSAATLAYQRAHHVGAGLKDQRAFEQEVAVDAFRDTPGEELLGGLRGKDVVVAFIESYGRDAVQDPEYASEVGAVLDAGNRRLGAAGYASKSAFLTSSTSGGSSWLAHATLLSGTWVNNQRRHHNLLQTDRMTLNSAFKRANWRTVGVMPGITKDWPEGEKFFGYNQVYDARDLGYRGPQFSFSSMPDQYTLSTFERLERAKRDRAPVMAEIALLSSHWPWAPIPGLVDWNKVGDGRVFGPMANAGDPADVVWKDPKRVRTEYRRSIEYSLNSLISYVEKYGDKDLVLVFLGDHQPAPMITGANASRDVPITIVAKDPAVLDKISGWGWQDGLKPSPNAPVWRMDAFRDRFLTAYKR